ncbi:MAG: aminotransferase class I/II-fold pyridoxal phosphate-dependent enzyme, partial [Bacteroidota bacterium]
LGTGKFHSNTVMQAAIEAIRQYGVQFYCVRAYLSLPPYEELEEAMSRIFRKPAIVMPSTALGHWATIPVIISPDDAIILDNQVHATVQMSAAIAKANGTHLERIRHNRLDYLENRIAKLSKTHRKVWYMADGVYSMFGDVAPMADLHELLDRHEQFYLYVDDAHGMSWAGRNGAGWALSKAPFHPKMVLISSLSKAFGTMGGVAVFPNEEMKTLVRNLGSTLIFTGPIQPALVAASLASAKIHLSDEIYSLQAKLSGRAQFLREKASELDLPFLPNEETPVFYLACGKMEVAFRLSKLMMENGFYAGFAIYPSVPLNQAGLRILPTVNHSLEDISNVLNALAELLPEALEAEGFSMDEIWQSFRYQQLVQEA